MIKLHIIFRWLNLWWLWRSRIEGYTSGDPVKPGNTDNHCTSILWNDILSIQAYSTPHDIQRHIPQSTHPIYPFIKWYSKHQNIFHLFQTGKFYKAAAQLLVFLLKDPVWATFRFWQHPHHRHHTYHHHCYHCIVTITLADHSDQSKYSVNSLNWTKISANPIVQKRNHWRLAFLPDLAARWLSVSTKTLWRTTTYQTRLGSEVF